MAAMAISWRSYGVAYLSCLANASDVEEGSWRNRRRERRATYFNISPEATGDGTVCDVRGKADMAPVLFVVLWYMRRAS